jgi:Fe-S-cluster-containing dehydrogenase component
LARYGILVDINKCNGCYNCFLACKDEYCGNDFPPYSLSQPMTGHFWMRIQERERGKFPKVKVAYTPIPCMHCDDASCVRIAQDGAIYRRPDGIVIIDPLKAGGQRQLVSSCPYRVIYWNEEKQVPQKCTLCAHILDGQVPGATLPRCVEACPTGALLFGDLDDPASEIARSLTVARTEPLHPEYRMKEKVVYSGLPKRFIAGSVVFGDTDECAEGVTVSIESAGQKQTLATNLYGDFEFEGLPADKDFLVRVRAKGYKESEVACRTRVDVYLGDIVLRKNGGRGGRKQAL